MLLVQAGQAVDDFIKTLVMKFYLDFLNINFLSNRFHYFNKVILLSTVEIHFIKIQ
jgi:hypothetical protein